MPSRVLYCHCAYAQAVPRPVKQEVLRALTDRGDDFDAVADLCEMSARKDPALKEFAACEHADAGRLLSAGGALAVQRRRRAARRVEGAGAEHAGRDGRADRRRPGRRRARDARRASRPAATGACRGAGPMSASITARSPLLVVLYEGAGAMPLDAEARFEITRALLEKGYRSSPRAPGAAARRRASGRCSCSAASPASRRPKPSPAPAPRSTSARSTASRRRTSSRSSKASAATPRRRSRAAGSRGSRSSTTAAAPTACSA